MKNRSYNACKNRWKKLQKQETHWTDMFGTSNSISPTPTSFVQDGKQEVCVVMRKRKNSEDGTFSVQITRKDIAKVWHLRQSDAAKQFGISEGALREACNELDLPRWGVGEGRRNPIENNVSCVGQIASEKEQEEIVKGLWTTPLSQKPETTEGVAVTSTEKGGEDCLHKLDPESAGLAMLYEQQVKRVEQQAMGTLEDKCPDTDANSNNLTATIEGKYSEFYWNELLHPS